MEREAIRETAPPTPVVFALEDRSGTYWMNTAVAMTSVVQHARSPVHIHVLHDETLGVVAAARFREICRAFATPLTLIAVQLPEGYDVARLRQFGRATVYRLMIPRLFRDSPAVIYLDSDLVANGVDVTDVIAASDPQRPLAGVVDPFIVVPKSHADQLLRLRLDPARYINAGVLVLRPTLIEDDLLGAFVGFSDANPTAIHPDQDFLNVHFQGRITYVPEIFNYQVCQYERRFLQPLGHYQGKLLHYAGKIKPLDGALAPGLIPFWAHAQFVEELAQAQVFQKPSLYLLAMENDANGLVLRQTLAPMAATGKTWAPDQGGRG